MLSKLNKKITNINFDFLKHLRIVLIVCGVIAIVATSIGFGVGPNFTTSMVGGHEARVTLGTHIDGNENKANLTDSTNKIKAVFKSAGVRHELIIPTGDGGESGILIRFGSTSDAKIAELQAALETQFATIPGLEVEIDEIGGMLEMWHWLGLIIAVVSVAALVFLYIFWRVNLWAALFMAVGILAEVLALMALTVMFYIPIGLPTLALVLGAVILSAYTKMLFAFNIEDEWRVEEDNDVYEATNKTIKQSLLRVAVITGIMLITLITLLSAGTTLIRMYSLPLIYIAPVIFAVTYFISSPLFAKLAKKFNNKPRIRRKRIVNKYDA